MPESITAMVTFVPCAERMRLRQAKLCDGVLRGIALGRRAFWSCRHVTAD